MSEPIFFVMFKGLIGFALPMLLAWRELVAVNRVIAQREALEAETPRPSPAEDGP